MTNRQQIASPEASATSDRSVLVKSFQAIVGRRYVRISPAATAAYRTGYRFGGGPVVAVVLPGTLVEQWRLLRACVAAKQAVIMQAANTGLTGGSTPDGESYGRGVVIISTTRLTSIHLINAARQVVCMPGASLNSLEKLLKPLGREPHSVIGSSCIGASVVGGVCNNSGGSLVQRGPAYTELSVFAHVDAFGVLHLVNHLGINLGEEPEEVLGRLDRRNYGSADIANDPKKRASDQDYQSHVRDIAAETPARFNADDRRLYEAAGSAGRLAVFAVRLDTFEKNNNEAVFYVGTNVPGDLTRLRRDILSRFENLPVSAEYIHREAFNIAEEYGKDTFLAIQWLGTQRLPGLFALKSRFDSLANRLKVFGKHASDHLLQWLASLLPSHLPPRMLAYRDSFAHHLILKVDGAGVAEARAHLEAFTASSASDYFECSQDEGAKAFLHRFAVAGAAVRYRAVHQTTVADIIALDIALPRNSAIWMETLPDEIERCLLHKLYYGHFLCQVFHQDYVVAAGNDPIALEHRMWSLLDKRGAQYPAEHNVGHLYPAPVSLSTFYRTLDPRNTFNPGIGKTSKLEDWR